ncbi:MAG: calcium/sodium antiporter, partial [Alphaproteobacteria bacterium]
ALGLVCLVPGASLLVSGASGLALAFGLSPLVVGLTIVAIGTSSPELAVTARSALAGEGGLAVGNVVGSNVCNVLLILGLSALVAPLAVARRVTRQEIPLMIVVSFAAAMLCRDGLVSRFEGFLLLAGYAAFTWFQLRQGTADATSVPLDTKRLPAPGGERSAGGWMPDVIRVVAGLVLLGLGASWMVDGAADVAHALGLSDLVIGLTVVAIGTSLPEIAASVAAAWRGEGDIAVGNVVGSNIANLLLILGVGAVLAPGGLSVAPEARQLDLPVMLVTAVACLPVALDGQSIARWEGGLFVAWYAAYLAYVVLSALANPLLGRFTDALVFFALPMSAVTLAVLLARGLRQELERDEAEAKAKRLPPR